MKDKITISAIEGKITLSNGRTVDFSISQENGLQQWNASDKELIIISDLTNIIWNEFAEQIEEYTYFQY